MLIHLSLDQINALHATTRAALDDLVGGDLFEVLLGLDTVLTKAAALERVLPNRHAYLQVIAERVRDEVATDEITQSYADGIADVLRWLLTGETNQALNTIMLWTDAASTKALADTLKPLIGVGASTTAPAPLSTVLWSGTSTVPSHHYVIPPEDRCPECTGNGGIHAVRCSLQVAPTDGPDGQLALFDIAADGTITNQVTG